MSMDPASMALEGLITASIERRIVAPKAICVVTESTLRENKSRKVKQAQPGKKRIKLVGSHVCSMCNVTCGTPEALAQHLGGKKHLSKVRQAKQEYRTVRDASKVSKQATAATPKLVAPCEEGGGSVVQPSQRTQLLCSFDAPHSIHDVITYCVISQLSVRTLVCASSPTNVQQLSGLLQLLRVPHLAVHGSTAKVDRTHILSAATRQGGGVLLVDDAVCRQQQLQVHCVCVLYPVVCGLFCCAVCVCCILWYCVRVLYPFVRVLFCARACFLCCVQPLPTQQI